MDSGPHRVSDVMTRAVVAVGRKALFKDIVERMQQWNVGALPVLEGDGRVIGVVSEADLLPKEEFRDRDPDRSTRLRRLPDLAKAAAVCAEELMSSPAVTVHADATLAEAARIMALKRVKRLPVVNAEGVLDGVISRGDLLKVFLRPDNDLADEIRRDVVDVLFPAPVEPVHIMVTDGVATLTGRVGDPERIPLAVRLVRGVEGIVGVDCRLTAAGSDSGSDEPVADSRRTG
ncbi:CBS domain-containing protein [Streptomyces tricolor]|uniref:CBS domain-containing protein n=1 Tax=Streptomyces tricolor TaxID=68277 RepID=A0ABS9J921_9ACTN|nr:CBS domain-containing protein [Streptomyces tricolor]MCG0062050.1 CBS domain-containing protein [Streptomyces tricolor]